MKRQLVLEAALVLLLSTGCGVTAARPAFAASQDTPEFRPQYHFTPPQHWMNDPNGLLYDKGSFNLFYQYNPLGDVAANQSWGHATSRDLLSWQDLPLAIPYIKLLDGTPTDLIFSGSAVRDAGDTSGFGHG
ncbi:glycosyl hydrolase family 32 domain-containing protein [Tanticharoenia sakaeratensis NBRC 103193]|uniref:Glycosyl hydrolase family 32 domain-containing protein n=1 Tax=Tanticharoenia sakaeratensis NBRC 103193 TaxID=1231623 RepID=A0A0D6MKV9_9PROT|nr:glycosyl hydrolase family 32 domain-containing protein [Tanticharoenia sakaeratensis NBRC 103193]GBQ24667.1 hypothetical protein AA103193_2814 [Tanticharoenia sakaeratensis NBRC 103193]